VEPIDVIESDRQQDDEDEHGRDAVEDQPIPLWARATPRAGVGAAPWYDVDATESGR
jgi:hypothetical protein